MNIDLNRVYMYVSMQKLHFVRLRKYNFDAKDVRKKKKSPLSNSSTCFCMTKNENEKNIDIHQNQISY